MHTSALTDPARLAAQISDCLEDSLRRLNDLGRTGPLGEPLGLGHLQVDAMTQTWPSTACGFPGGAGRAMTTALTVAVTVASAPALTLVYIDGRFAYQDDPERLADALADRRLPGLAQWRRQQVPAPHASSSAICGWAQRTFGQELTAYLICQPDPQMVGRYAHGTDLPDQDTCDRLRHLLKVTGKVCARDGAEQARALLLGSDPALRDRTPAELLHDGQFDLAADTIGDYLAGRA